MLIRPEYDGDLTWINCWFKYKKVRLALMKCCFYWNKKNNLTKENIDLIVFE